MGESLRAWSYVLARDLGIAPCADHGILTLCTCKPRIRAGAAVGDWVLATLPKRFGNGRVAYVGRVAERIETGAYGDRYPNRPDALYERAADGRLVHRGGDYHAEPELVRRDLGVNRCLRFEPFWYFGGAGPSLRESLLALCHYHVGQAVRPLGADRFEALQAWLAGWPHGVDGEPRERASGEGYRARMAFLAEPRFAGPPPRERDPGSVRPGPGDAPRGAPRGGGPGRRPRGC